MTNVTLTASEYQDHVGEAFDRSLSQPVVITKHGRPRNVVLSYGEYERLCAHDRRAARVENLSDDELAAIGASEMEHGFEHVNARARGAMIGEPRIGRVLRYSYLWADDRQAGAEGGAKNWPCGHCHDVGSLLAL